MKTEQDLISSSKLKIDGQIAHENIIPVKRPQTFTEKLQPIIDTLKRVPTLSEKLFTKMKSIGKDDLKAHIHQKKQKSTQEQIQYDPDALPPDFHKAMDHRLATIVGNNLNEQELEDEHPEHCECCARQIQKKYLDLNCQLQDLAFLGSGYTLYFIFLQYCQIILLCLFLSSGLFNSITSFMGDSCLTEKELLDTYDISQQCSLNWITALSIGNKMNDTKVAEIQNILNFVSIFIIIFVLQCLRKKQRETDIECNKKEITPEDYTLFVKNIPRDFNAINDDYDDDLKEFLQNCGLQNTIEEIESLKLSSGKIEIVDIVLCYDLSELSELDEQKQKILEKKKKSIINLDKYKKELKEITLQEINQQLVENKQKKIQLQHKLIDGKGKEFMKKYFIGKAFVQFNYHQQLIDFQEHHKSPSLMDRIFFRNCHYMIYHGHILQFYPAPSPSDVFWSNLGQTHWDRILKHTVGNISFSFMFGIVIYITFQLQEFQQYADENYPQGSLMSYLSSLSVSYFILISNVILQQFSFFLGDYYKFETRTQYNIEVTKSIAQCLFINSGIIPFILQVLVYNNYIGKIFGNGGLVFNQNFVFFNGAIINPLMAFIDLEGKISDLKRFLFIKENEKCMLTQKELNQYWERPEIKIFQIYAVCVVQMFLTAFYSIIMPICILYSLMAISLQYWTQKFAILRQKSIKYAIGPDLNQEMIEFIEYFLPIFACSNLLFALLIGGSFIVVFPLLGVGVSILHALLPMDRVNEKLYEIPEMGANEQTLEQAQPYFTSNFKTENPASSEIELAKKVEHLYKRKQTIMQQKNSWPVVLSSKVPPKEELNQQLQISLIIEDLNSASLSLNQQNKQDINKEQSVNKSVNIQSPRPSNQQSIQSKDQKSVIFKPPSRELKKIGDSKNYSQPPTPIYQQSRDKNIYIQPPIPINQIQNQSDQQINILPPSLEFQSDRKLISQQIDQQNNINSFGESPNKYHNESSEQCLKNLNIDKFQQLITQIKYLSDDDLDDIYKINHRKNNLFLQRVFMNNKLKRKKQNSLLKKNNFNRESSTETQEKII